MKVEDLEQVASLNNKGCCDLTAMGNREHAMKRFRSALTYLRSVLHKDRDRSSGDCTASSRSKLLPLSMKTLQSQIHAAHNVTCSRSINDWESKESYYSIYCDAMPIIAGHDFCGDATGNNRVFTAIVVFNLALTLHLQGFYNGSLRDLQKAKSLYLHTYNLIAPIINAHYQESCATNNVAFDLLVVALLNNTAWIHLELFEFTEGHSVFESLIQYAKISSFRSNDMTASRQEGAQTAYQGGQRSSYEEFMLRKVEDILLNATLMKLNGGMLFSAAAAA